MAYNENIPQPTDQQSDSQGDLLNNFQAIKTAWDINHVAMNLSGEGKHNYVTLPVQASGPVTSATEIALYSKLSALTGAHELFFREQSSGGEIECTSSLDANPGWAILPCGIILKWGTQSSTGYDTILFPTGASIPAFTTILSMQLTPYDDTAITDLDEAIRIVKFSNPVQFEVFASARTTTGATNVAYQYLAIGV